MVQYKVMSACFQGALEMKRTGLETVGQVGVGEQRLYGRQIGVGFGRHPQTMMLIWETPLWCSSFIP